MYHHDLKTYRFTPAPSAFSSSDSSCFCPTPGGCAPEGMFNVTACQGDAPMLLSWPHFYGGDPSLVEQVEGLSPDKDKHQFGIDILPQLGVGLRAAIRLQINIFLELVLGCYVLSDFILIVFRVDGVTALANTTDAFLPIVWFDDGIEELNDPDTISLLK